MAPTLSPPSGPVTSHVFRLNPGDSLLSTLRDKTDSIFAQHSHCSAFILTAVGSLEDVTLRLANASRKDDEKKQSENQKNNCTDKNDIRRWSNQRFEIVSLVGTISPRRYGHHLHISLSDGEGKTIGGHLIDGVVFTTVEIVLGTVGTIELTREHDDKTGYRELVARQIEEEVAAAPVIDSGGKQNSSGSGGGSSSVYMWINGSGVAVLVALLTGVAVGSLLPKRR